MAQGGRGYFANGYWHTNYWHVNYWAGSSVSAVIDTERGDTEFFGGRRRPFTMIPLIPFLPWLLQ